MLTGLGYVACAMYARVACIHSIPASSVNRVLEYEVTRLILYMLFTFSTCMWHSCAMHVGIGGSWVHVFVMHVIWCGGSCVCVCMCMSMGRYQLLKKNIKVRHEVTQLDGYM